LTTLVCRPEDCVPEENAYASAYKEGAEAGRGWHISIVPVSVTAYPFEPVGADDGRGC
jgi:hypothetical protein